jgi:5-hydroxyisourate hydrolase
MSTLSTHILDTSRGKPAEGVGVVLEFAGKVLGRGKTNSDGRLPELLAKDAKLSPGVYRLTFDTGAYFQGQGLECFYPSVTVDFEIRDGSHHHVPLLLSPYGYSTYRGS